MLYNNFYQSHIWRYINEHIYKKPVFEIELFWKKYFWIIKEKKVWPFLFKWFQIMWVVLWDYSMVETIAKIKRQLSWLRNQYWNNYKNIMVQIWFVDNIMSFDISELDKKWFSETVKKQRENINKIVLNNFDLYPSFRENMPLATVAFNISKWIDELWSDMTKSARNHIKKAQKNWLYFELANSSKDWEEFYDIWKQTADTKWFHIIPHNTFLDLKDFVLSRNYWNLFLAKKDWKIVSWSLCFFVNDWIIYMYWATNRDFGNVWWHQFLKYEMFNWWHQNWYNYADLLWVSPTWYVWHHLDWVTAFKQSLWWTKIEYYGNFDIILNPWLYKLFKFMRR